MKKNKKFKFNNNKTEEYSIEKVEIDFSKYEIIESNYPFKKLTQLHRLYYGDLGASIMEYEERFGEIKNKIYHDVDRHLIAIVIEK
jgi:hypothetical protein